MAGLHLLKHMKGLSDEETCAAWLENPYFQAFCGETHFQHRLLIRSLIDDPLAPADRGG